MTQRKTLSDLTSSELKEVIEYVSDAYNNRGATRPEMTGELQTVYGLSHEAANKIQDAVTQARIRPW